jgi:hypothetical protein
MTVFLLPGYDDPRAGSQAAFREVDYVYPLAVARAAQLQGAKQFLFVSSMGADARSSVFYSRVKGELEAAIAALGYRAPLRSGHRCSQAIAASHRPGERVALMVLRRCAGWCRANTVPWRTRPWRAPWWPTPGAVSRDSMSSRPTRSRRSRRIRAERALAAFWHLLALTAPLFLLVLLGYALSHWGRGPPRLRRR